MNDYYEVYKNRPITPIFGSRLGIRDIYVNGAIKENKLMRVWTVNGIAIEDPKEWKKRGVPGKKVYKYPDNPMKLLYADAQILPKPTREDQEKDNYYKYNL